MKPALQKALRAKQLQRQRSAAKSVAEKLAIVERLRDRNAPMKAVRRAAQEKAASRDRSR